MAEKRFKIDKFSTRDPEKVAEHIDQIAGRWFTTHLKCGKDGAFQPVLTDNPMSYKKVFELMSGNRIRYAALELLSVDNKQECFKNHHQSIEYLSELGIVEVH